MRPTRVSRLSRASSLLTTLALAVALAFATYALGSAVTDPLTRARLPEPPDAREE